jgi:hypothetical protein
MSLCVKMNEGGRSWLSGTAGVSVLAGVLLLGSGTTATAQNVPAAAADHVWAGCVLTLGELVEVDIGDDQTEEVFVPGSLDLLRENVAQSLLIPDEDVEIAFVVVYALNNPNNGQPVPGGFTGPIICTNPGNLEVQGFGITGFEEDNATRLTEASEIPTDTDPGGAASVDIVGAEEAFILQYQLNGGSNDGKVEKRVCHTVAGNTDCFIVHE